MGEMRWEGKGVEVSGEGMNELPIMEVVGGCPLK